MKKHVAFINARLIDPASGLDLHGGLRTEGNVIKALGKDVGPVAGDEIIDCQGKALCPGLIDMRSFSIDGEAAAAGGVTTVALMPNLNPPVDNPAMVDYVLRMGRDDAFVRVRPVGAATKKLEGVEIAEIGLMRRSGAVAFTDGRAAIPDAAVMLRLLTYANTFGCLVIQHAEEPSLTRGASATEGELATRMGLPAAPDYAEAIAIERDIRLVEDAGARYHVAQVTTRAGLDVIRRAKDRGLKVTCGVTPAHFALNELAISDYRTFTKMSPPLRAEADRMAVSDAIADGTIDVIASGHDPRSEEDKRLPFSQAEAGMVGYETLLPVALSLYHEGKMGLSQLLGAMTARPADLLGEPSGRLAVDAPADLLLFDPDAPWRFDEDQLRTAAKNTPFDGRPMQGRVLRTFCDGYDSFVLD